MHDIIDLKIIRALESDGRISFAALGEAVGLSKTPCWNRVQEMQRQGIITGFGAHTDPALLGLEIRALVNVVISFGAARQFEQAVSDHRFITTCYAVTGEFDYVLEIFAADIENLDRLLRDDLSKLPGVMRFNTSITTRLVKNARAYADMVEY